MTYQNDRPYASGGKAPGGKPAGPSKADCSTVERNYQGLFDRG